MNKEKKKLLLVATSLGVFLVIIFGAAALVLAPRAGAPGRAAFTAAGGAPPIPPGVGAAGFAPPAQAGNVPAGNFPVIQVAPHVTAAQETNFFIDGAALGQGADATVTITVPAPAATPVPQAGMPVTRPEILPPAAARVGQAPAAAAPAAQVVVRPAPPAGVAVAPAPQAAARPAAPAPVARPPAVQPGAVAMPPAQAAPPQAAAAPPAALPQAVQVPAAVVTRPPAPQPQQAMHIDYWIQTGAFSGRVRAEGAREALALRGITSIIDNREIDGRVWYRVRVGPYASSEEANHWLALVSSIDGFTDSQVRQTASLR